MGGSQQSPGGGSGSLCHQDSPGGWEKSHCSSKRAGKAGLGEGWGVREGPLVP